jgi:crotonobetaine/carnitine-CoA ligase
MLEAVISAKSPHLTTIISDGPASPAFDCAGATVFSQSALYGDADNVPEPAEPIEPWYTQSIIYTSGTIGRSKGVLSSYMHSYSAMSPDTWRCTRPGDRHLLHMPIFHIGGAFVANACLCSGSSIAVVPSFKTDTFWQSLYSTSRLCHGARRRLSIAHVVYS